MRHYRYNIAKHCRWCGESYMAVKPVDRDGFHSKACKQAHYRAYKKYVTTKKPAQLGARGNPVTQKGKKKQ